MARPLPADTATPTGIHRQRRQPGRSQPGQGAVRPVAPGECPAADRPGGGAAGHGPVQRGNQAGLPSQFLPAYQVRPASRAAGPVAPDPLPLIMPRSSPKPSKKLLQRKARVEAILPILKATYPDAKCRLAFETPLQLLLAT